MKIGAVNNNSYKKIGFSENPVKMPTGAVATLEGILENKANHRKLVSALQGRNNNPETEALGFKFYGAVGTLVQQGKDPFKVISQTARESYESVVKSIKLKQEIAKERAKAVELNRSWFNDWVQQQMARVASKPKQETGCRIK